MTQDQVNSTTTLLLDQTQRMLEQHLTPDLKTACEGGFWAAALWQTVCESGLQLALVPEESGGIGLGWPDAMRLVRLTARFALPLPLADTMVALWIWTDAGGAIPDRPISLGAAQPGEKLLVSSDGTLDGQLQRAGWPDQALALCPVIGSDGTWQLALLDVQGSARRPNLAGEPRGSVMASDLSLSAAEFRSASGDAQEALFELGALIRSQQMVGAMQECFDLTLAYVGQRVQFGRPISKFQAIQQMLAEAAGHLAAATAAADQAMEAAEGPDRTFFTAVAKARCGEAGGAVAALTHQIHGAIGFTKEYPLHHFTRRIWAWREEFGNETFWQDRLGRLACAKGGSALWQLLLREVT